MRKWMNDCVFETPEASLNMIKNRKSLVGPLVEIFTKKPYKKLLLVGSGSSYNIALTSRFGLQRVLKIKVEVIYAATYAHYDYEYHEDTLVILLSQSGRSTNLIAAARRVVEIGQDAIAMTMVPDSPVTNYIKNSFTYGTNQYGRDVFVCRGVPTSVLFYNLFALEAALKQEKISSAEYKDILKEIELTISLLDDNYKTVEAFYEEIKHDVLDMKRIQIVGTAVGYGVATEGALKIAETIGLAANSYETDEFLHGPTYEIKKDHAVFIVDLEEKLHERHLAIYQAVKLLTDKVYLITRFEDFVDKNVVYLKTGNYENILALPFVVPFQLICSNLTEEFNIQAHTVYNNRVSRMIGTKANID